MGSCHSLPLLLEKDIEEEVENKQCMICSDEISLESGIYVKCTKCQILLHSSCGQKYKSNTKSNTIFCPHCKNRNSLFFYENDINSCKKI
jgi:DNA-directed RNA polymerase subunit RPC12/RpoP